MDFTRSTLIFTISIILICLQTTPLVSSNKWSKSHVLNTCTVIEINSDGSLTVRREDDIVIANESDKDIGYDHFRETKYKKFEKFTAVIYDSTGKQLKKLKKSDIRENTISFNALYDEHIDRFHVLSYSQLPYRIHRVLEYKCLNQFYLPDWDPQRQVDVTEAKLEVITKEPHQYKYREIGDIQSPKIFTDKKKNNHIVWEVYNIPAFKDEYRSAPEKCFQIGVKLMPTQFNLDGYAGSTENWETFGNWFYNLARAQMIPNQEFVGFRQLIDTTSTKKTINNLYHYLQEKTRYVRIDMGIDGWQPHHVDDTHKLKYGDCNDLSTYMIALLKHAGIEAYTALALTRNHGFVDVNFPGNQFNHCITVVPLSGDTLFLECTSDACAYCDPPASIEGTYVLLSMPSGSHLIKVPLSTADRNGSRVWGGAKLLSSGILWFKGYLQYTGNQAIQNRAYLQDCDEKKKREWFMNLLMKNVGNIHLESFEIQDLDNTVGPLILSVSFSLDDYARKVGTRYIFNPRIFNRIEFDGESPDERNMALLNMSRFSTKDDIDFALPLNYHINKEAFSDSLESQFGEYLFQCTPTESGLKWSSSFKLHAREVPLDQYSEYYQFMNEAVSMSNKKLVMYKN